MPIPVYHEEWICPAVSVLDNVKELFLFASSLPHLYPIAVGREDEPSHYEPHILRLWLSLNRNLLTVPSMVLSFSILQSSLVNMTSNPITSRCDKMGQHSASISITHVTDQFAGFSFKTLTAHCPGGSAPITRKRSAYCRVLAKALSLALNSPVLGVGIARKVKSSWRSFDLRWGSSA